MVVFNKELVAETISTSLRIKHITLQRYEVHLQNTNMGMKYA